MTVDPGEPRQAGVVGSPIQHSLSPVLHRAAYRALGLRHWSYHRDEVAAGALADFVAGLPVSWVGLSVTMPGKEEALALGEQVTERARLTGAANTLVRGSQGWWADNTDVDGITRALAGAGCRHAESAWVVGSGATARSVLVAVHGLGVRHVVLHVRSTPRSATMALAETLGITVAVRRYEQGWPRWGDFEVAVSTAPAGGAPSPPPGGRVSSREAAGVWALDVAYQQRGEWARGLGARGAVVVPGSEMLLHQAAQQVQAMTGQVAPLEAMRSALASSGGPAHR